MMDSRSNPTFPTFEQQISQLTFLITETLQKITHLSEQVTTLQGEIASLRNQIAHQQTCIDFLHTVVKDTKQSINNVQSDLNSYVYEDTDQNFNQNAQNQPQIRQ